MSLDRREKYGCLAIVAGVALLFAPSVTGFKDFSDNNEKTIKERREEIAREVGRAQDEEVWAARRILQPGSSDLAEYYGDDTKCSPSAVASRRMVRAACEVLTQTKQVEEKYTSKIASDPTLQEIVPKQRTNRCFL